MTKSSALGWALLVVCFTGCQTAPRLHAPTPLKPEPQARREATVIPAHSATARGAIHEVPPARRVNDSALRTECYRWLGVPYRVGGMTEAGCDCSGFTCAIYLKVFGIKLPRTSITQFRFGTAIVPSQMKEGDLVFFQTSTNAPVTHVGIYLGQGQFAHSSTKRGVIISKLHEGYYSERFRGARRVIQK